MIHIKDVGLDDGRSYQKVHQFLKYQYNKLIIVAKTASSSIFICEIMLFTREIFA